jgi:hypothetical protein
MIQLSAEQTQKVYDVLGFTKEQRFAERLILDSYEIDERFDDYMIDEVLSTRAKGQQGKDGRQSMSALRSKYE